MGTRTETDTMGAIEVDDARYWGAQTQRSLENFRIGTERMPRELILALVAVKEASARANRELGLLGAAEHAWIEQAIALVRAHDLPTEFPLAVWQTGSGTQTNMN